MQQTARAAVLTAPKTFEIREYPIPAIGDDEMLIKVEACGVCGTDGHEYNRDPFGLCPVVLGHEGTGEIVAMGRNITKDTAGNPVALGDKIVTCIIPCGTCDACLNTPARTNLCENVGVYGLMPDDDVHLNGYFGEYLVIRKGSTFFNVSGMTLDQRILVEPAAVVVHSLERAKSTGLLKFNSVVLVQGCGPIGLLQIATLRTLGIETIIAVDGNDSRLELAKEALVNKKYNDAVNLLKQCLEYPDHLGEGKLFNAQENDFYYFLGMAYQGLGEKDRAKECWEKATLGSQEPAAAMYYNDAKPDKIFYQGLAFKQLGDNRQANSRFYKLINYGKNHLFEKQIVDYFAVSLPDLLIWEDSLDLRNQIHCEYMLTLGYYGLGDMVHADKYLKKIEKLDINHDGIRAFRTLVDLKI